MRVLAAVDIGTNSVKLLAAKVRPHGTLRIVRHEVHITRIGEGIARTGRLAPRAMRRTLRRLLAYARTARALGAERVRAVATYALRAAPNGRAFIAELRRKTGWDVEIVSGRREAELGVRGATLGLSLPGPAVFLDVGGGSAQVTVEGSGARPWWRSFPLGAVRLTERFVTANPVPESDLERLRRHVRRTLDPVARHAGLRGLPVVGIGGTVACLGMVRRGTRRVQDLQGRSLSFAGIAELVRAFARRSVEERMAMPGMDPGRADVIAAGAAVVAEVLAALRAPGLRISTFGIRFGLLAEMAREPRKARKG